MIEHKRAEVKIHRHAEELQARTYLLQQGVCRARNADDLKKEINALCEKIGTEPRYNIEFEEE